MVARGVTIRPQQDSEASERAAPLHDAGIDPHSEEFGGAAHQHAPGAVRQEEQCAADRHRAGS